MLTALENGVKGGRWFQLMDKVHSDRNLRAAFVDVARNQGAAGVDHQTTTAYARRLDENLKHVADALRMGKYVPQAVRRVQIPKPGSTETRPLGIPTVQDRVVQAAVRNVLEPIFERDFAEQSYGFRPGRGCKDALRRVDALLLQGHTHVVDVDLKSYFDTIPHDRLMTLIRRKVSDGRLLDLLQAFLAQDIFDGLTHWTPEQGTPQGAVLSPLLSNIYLDPLDHLLAERGIEMVRYADDFVILCRTPDEAQAALAQVQSWAAEAGLTVHPTKTRLVDAARESFDFLGYRFARGRKYPRPKSMQKVKDAMREKTRRTDGRSLSCIITDLNRTLRGWFEYFKHAYKNTFPAVDGWVRGRLRSVLRKRQGRRGRGRGADHQRWPNAYFHEHGLFSLKAAHDSACQSSSR